MAKKSLKQTFPVDTMYRWWDSSGEKNQQLQRHISYIATMCKWCSHLNLRLLGIFLPATFDYQRGPAKSAWKSVESANVWGYIWDSLW